MWGYQEAKDLADYNLDNGSKNSLPAYKDSKEAFGKSAFFIWALNIKLRQQQLIGLMPTIYWDLLTQC